MIPPSNDEEDRMLDVRKAGKPSLRRVRLAVRLTGAEEAAITGDFNGWDPAGIPLHHAGDRLWYVLLQLPPGEYQYRLRVDDAWVDDPEAEHLVPNPYGTANALMKVR
jgi:1,4-alpha-glucan branching enzyme